jgi:hypothetical protein
MIIATFAIALFLVIIGGYFAWTYFFTQNQNNLSTPSFSRDQIRDQAMVYIAANHTITFPLIQGLAWSGGKQDTGLLGSETYLYRGGNWSISIQNPVVPKPIYTITANYSSNGCIFGWVGTYQNGEVDETGNSITTNTQLTLAQDQMRDLIILYLQAYHNQTEPYLKSLTWMGGRMTPMGMMGSEFYSYQSSGWNVTMQYPVVPNPLYAIVAQYKPAQYWNTGDVLISWQGTMQNGTIKETGYKFNPLA